MNVFVPPPGQSESMDRIAEAANYNEWLLQRMQPYLGRRVLDFGAGIGTFTDFVATGREVVALEPDRAFLPLLEERFRDREGVSVRGGDDTTLDDLDEIFDSAICLNVLEHIADDAGTLVRLRARLAPGGHLLLLVPAHQALFGEIDRNVGHERRYDRRLLRRRLAAARFEVVELRYVNPVGALGWLVSSRFLRRRQVPAGPLRLYDALVPLLRPLDALPLPFGLSLWAVARRGTE